MGEKAVYATHAHVFQIDPETKKKWIPSSGAAVRVAFYHDPSRRTYRIIAIEDNKALVNSTITANMNFTKTSPKFGQWSDHRANTVFGLGFSTEKDLLQFVDKFNDAKSSAKVLLEERKKASQKALDQDQPQSPAGSSPSPISPPSGSSPSPISPLVKSPPPEATQSKQEPQGIVRKNSSTALVNGSDLQEGGRVNGSAATEQPQMAVSSSTLQSSPGLGRSMSGATPEAQAEALKYENSKLKVALANSAQNVKKWESEMQTLKNNNTRLTTALEESTQHVAEWKKQLQRYKEESDALKKKVQEMESGRAEHSSAIQEVDGLRRENEELKEVLSAVQLDLEAGTEELHNKETELHTLREQLLVANSKLQPIEEENQSLVGQVAVLEDQLKMASVASKRKLADAQESHRELGSKLQEVLRLHKEMDGHLNT